MEIELQDLKNYLSTSQVAETYGLSRQSVLASCDAGLLGHGAVNTRLGWLISQEVAARCWGRRGKGGKEGKEVQKWNKAIRILKYMVSEKEKLEKLPEKIMVDIQDYPNIKISFVLENQEFYYSVKKS